ncbi:hypothetical protein PRIPAC_75108 [Pristionchus pacificus]|uniref:Uncharacterized protein n=1 Tax=Pristionchus pacificus TaxID=54126 RepID=A0A2A6CSA4_PRIPA|nr:hypothetical protein PRIPAC_75108 [Pristionchus pacificus]|eukprot:PDM81019.1 hypothetical protein PRIPAC_36022 [Pristionchus pacificus]
MDMATQGIRSMDSTDDNCGSIEQKCQVTSMRFLPMRIYTLLYFIPFVASLQSKISLDESDENEVNVIIDINADRFVKGLSDLTDSFNDSRVDDIEIGEEECGDTEMDQIVGRVLSDRMKMAAKTEHLVCTTLIQVLDDVIRELVKSVKMAMILPSDSSLIYSLINNPTWFNTSSSSSNLLRFHLHSHFHLHLQRDLPLPQMDPLLRMGSLRPLDHNHHRTHSLLPLDSPLPSDPLYSPSDSLLHSPSPFHFRSALQPFDVYYHILDSSFTKSITHLCKKGFFDEMLTVPRGDFNISLELQCEGKPRVDLSDLHGLLFFLYLANIVWYIESWKLKVGLPLLYIYRNDSNTQIQLVDKILTLSIHHDRLRLSFIVQSAFPQPNEPGRFVFSNQIFRHLSSVINQFYTIPLPFVDSVYSTLPFVSAIDNRLVLAVNLTAIP